jgi:hypothetical protein
MMRTQTPQMVDIGCLPQCRPSTQNIEASSLFDDVVGQGNYIWWDGETECFCRPTVNEQFKLGRLLDWQVTGLGALKNSIHIDSCAVVAVGEMLTIAEEAPGLHVLSKREY